MITGIKNKSRVEGNDRAKSRTLACGNRFFKGEKGKSGKESFNSFNDVPRRFMESRKIFIIFHVNVTRSFLEENLRDTLCERRNERVTRKRREQDINSCWSIN